MGRATINDVAERAQVSVGTVHRALYDKPGVSRAVRERILEVAHELGYRPNRMASSLRKKPLNIVVAFPAPTSDNRYFYGELWNGCRDAEDLFASHNCNVIHIPYYEDDVNSFSSNMGRVLLQYKNSVDGVLIGGKMKRDDIALAGLISKKPYNIPLIAVGEVFDDISCLASIQSDHETDGKMAAEILGRQMDHSGDILMAAGDVTLHSNQSNSQAFESYLREHFPEHRIYKVFDNPMDQSVAMRVSEILKTTPGIRGMYAVSARSTMQILKAAEECGLAGKIAIVGSDLHEDTARYLRDGFLSAVIFKNPANQAKTGIGILLDHLVWGKQPQTRNLRLTSLIVNRANVDRYLPLKQGEIYEIQRDSNTGS